jgi:RHS repeat-associated protein
MNRISRFYSLLSRILIVLAFICTPLVGRSATTATPAFSPVAGTYTSAQTVTITDSTNGSTIYYTADGTTPTTSSTRYTSAIVVSATETLKAIATASGKTNSAVASAVYTLQVPTPTFSLPTGSYAGSQTVTISDTNSTATVYYTTNGSTPTTSSTRYTSAILVSATETLKAIAVVTGYTNSAVASVTYTISTTPGALNVYLSQPGAQSTSVTGAITETFDALSTGIHTSVYVSTAGIGSYTGSSANPFAILAHDVYGGATDSSSSTPTNYFAVGNATSSTSPAYLTFSQPVSYFGFWWSAGDQYNRVAIYSGSTLCGSFSTADLLTFLNNGVGSITATNGAVYQTSAYFGNPNLSAGSNDSAEPFAYVSFSVTGVSITQVAFYNTSTSSAFESDNHSIIYTGNTVTIPTTFVPVETLTLGSQVAAPVFNPQGGTPLNLGISSTTPGASINYTTNGTVPTPTTGTVCGTPCTIQVSVAETIKAIAYETGMTNSTVSSVTYTIPTLTVTSSGNPSTFGSSVTFTATISSGPTGNVTFYDSGISIGTGTISGNTATLATSTLVTGTHTVTAGWIGNGSYGSVLSSAITQTVNKATPTVTAWPTASGISYGQTLASSALSGGTASVAGTFAWTTPSTVPNAGTASQSVTFTPSVLANYNAVVGSVSVTVAKATPTVSVWPTASGISYGQTLASSTLSGGTASVAGTFAWTMPSTAPGVGTASQSVTFTPTDTTDYNTPAPGSVSVTVSKATPTITFTVSNQTYGVTPFAVSASSNSTGAFTYSVVSGPATISGSTVTITGVGTVVLQASQVASGNYTAGTQNATFTVSAEAPTITFTVSNQTYGVSPFAVSASSNSTGAITYSVVSGPATISGSTVTLTGVGTVVLQASQAASGNYTAGTQNATFTVSAEAPTITFTVSNQTYGVAPFEVLASSNSTGAITYSVVSGPATISGSTVTITGVGTVVLQASQAASGNYTAGTQNATFTVSAEVQTISFANLGAQTVGTPLTLAATASSGLAVSFTSATQTICTVSGTTATFIASGTCTIDANQAGNSTYAAAAMVAQSFAVNNQVVTITVTPSNATLYGGQTQQFTASVSNSSNQAVTWAYTESTNVINYLSNGFTAPSLSLNGGATITPGGQLQLTDGGGGEARSAWFTTEVPVQTFTTDFTFQQINANGDGMSFTIQGQGAGAVGGSGGGMGYSSIPTSVAVKFALYGWSNGATGLYVDGAAPNSGGIDLSSTGINLHSGDVMDAHLVYDGTNLTMTLTDTATNASVTEVFPVDIPSIVGGNTAYVGFTGGTGAATATQNVLSWTYTSPQTVTSSDSILLYTAPATISTQQTVTITATSQADTTQSASATVTLIPPVSVSVTPSSASLYGGQTQQFSPTVINTTNTAVNWAINPTGLGSVDSTGLYTAPAQISTFQTVTVTATSQADATKSGSASVALLPVSAGSGPAGTVLTITGGGFGSGEGTSSVTVGGLPAVTLSWSDTQIQAQIPTGTGLGPQNVAVTVGGQVDADVTFTVTPGLVGITPAPGGTSASTTIETPGQQAPLIFNGTAGQLVSVWTSNSGSLSCNLHISIVGPDGSILGNIFQCNNPFFLNPVTLPTTGVYSVVIAPSNGATGSATVTLWLFNEQTGTITSGVPVPLTFNTPGQNAQLSFNGTAGEMASVSSTNSDSLSCNFHISIVGPDGSTLGTTWWCSDSLSLNPITLPTTGIYTVLIAPSSGVTGTATVLLTEAFSVTVNPPSMTLYGGQAQQFTATEIDTTNPAVTWTLTPATGAGTLSSSGLYTAPATIPTQQTVTVTATRVADPTAFGQATATVTLVPISITVNPPKVTLYGGQAQPFTATVNNTSNPAVTWTYSMGTNLINYPNGGFTAADLSLNGSAAVKPGGLLQLTDGGYWEAGAAWYSTKVPIQTFTTDFSFQILDPTADGITFTIQGQGTGALGSDGGGLGYRYIPTSVAVKFDIWNNAGEGIDSTGLYTNGAYPDIPAIDLSSTGINLHSGDVMNALLAYDGTNLTMTLTDTVTNASVTESFPVDIPSIVGGNSAYVGFTGGTGLENAIQNVLSWTYTGLQETVNGGNSNPFVYSPPASTFALETVIVTATSEADPTKSAQATATLMPPVAASVAPARVMLNGGQSQMFTANTSTSNTGVLWTINPAVGSINATGLYTAPATVSTQQTVTVTATNKASGIMIGSAIVTLMPPTGSLAITPNTVQPLSVGGQQVFTVYASDVSGNLVPNIKVGLFVTGVDNLELDETTDSAGNATFIYQDVNPGIALVQAVASINGGYVLSNTVTVPWTLPVPSTCGTLILGITAEDTVTLPNTLQLNGTATDSSLPTESSPTITWSQVSGPGTVTFSPSNQFQTYAAFSQEGNYVLEMSASDSVPDSCSLQWQVTVNHTPGLMQGWIGSPLYGSAVSGVVPITVASGVTLQSGNLIYYPANNLNNVTVLNANVTGSGQIGVLDTTTLANGSYWIQLHATDTNGDQQYSLILVTVAGGYKPGRVTATVTDLVVPATGLAINIQRSYDSLNAATSGDFGYGWNLGINVNLTVDPKGDVTFTLGGQRKTFYLTLENGGFLFPGYYLPVYTPEPGLNGTLTDSTSGCADLFDILSADGFCVDGGNFNPRGYIYTDPNGTAYNISAAGNVQSIQDRSGNGLTITANGITSTTGLSVPFVRDSSNRITQITDPNGNIYSYAYDGNGNLASVTYPNTSQTNAICANTTEPNTSTYTYGANHLYTGGTDARCNVLPTTAYYSATDTDPNGNSLNGRLQSVTDALGETTSYAYNLATNTTTVTYPADANGNIGTATMVYDSYGMLLSSTDPLGNNTTNVYDANHNLISTTDPLGHTSTSTYDSNGNKTSSTYPATATSTNTTSTTAYNQYSEPTSTTDELGNVRTFNYDANYNPQSVTDSAGTLASFIFNSNSTLVAGAIGFDISVRPAMASQFAYDANGNMTSRIDALGRVTSYTYDSLGRKLTMTAPTPTTLTGSSASTTTYSYDALGNLTQTAAPLGQTTTSAFDANGNKLYDIGARGYQTNYVYDALNRLVETDYPDGTRATKTYDFRNNVIRETDQSGNVTLHGYDLAGRQTSVTRGYGTSNASTTTTAYDADGRKESETDALGHATNYTYDADNRLTAVAGVSGNTSYAYDDAGNQTARTNGNGNTTHFQYDARKRLTTTVYPDATTVTNTYDGPGNLGSVTDQAGHVVQYAYDAANQLKTVIQTNHPNPSNNTNFYGYDNLGNLTGLTDENLHTTVNSFDLLTRPIAKTLPDGSLTETRQYDTAGNLTSLTHFNGVATSYTYDALNRLLTRTTLGEAPVGFTYTATGKYATSTAQDGTVNYAYDSLDRLTTKATPEGTLSYTYDAAGHVETIASSNSNGASVSYAYDELNRLSAVTDNRLQGNQTTSYTYDAASNVATATLPNGLQSSFTYDTLNRLTQLVTPVSGYNYQLGPTGARTQAVESTGRTINWSYDGINRLTAETIASDPSHNNGSASYGLDPVGNRLSDTSTLSAVNSGSWTYNTDDEISSETYDANGNVLTSGGKTYTYDSENHMTSMTASGTAVTMVYDAFGNRVAKTVNGVITKYLVEDDVNPTGLPQVIDEVQNGAAVRTYTYGLQRISEEQVVNGAWTPSFYGYDGAGSVRQLTNSAGAVTDEYEYDAFGNSFTKVGSTPNNYLYRGEQYDSDLSLYYLRARYYNAGTGRFLSRDPEDGKAKDPASLHKYLYAGGDPVNMADPSGRAEMFDIVELDTRSTLEINAERLVGKALKNVFCYVVEMLWAWRTPYGSNISNPFSQACWEWVNGS